MMVGVSIAFSITAKAWQRFQMHPMLTSLTLTNNEEQLYPTVTICPLNAESSDKVATMIREMGVKLNDSKEIAELLTAIPVDFE